MTALIGLLLVAFGVPSAIWPYEFARFEEQLDAIGSKRSWSEVEPADWKVTLTRVAGVAMALFGVVVLISGG